MSVRMKSKSAAAIAAAALTLAACGPARKALADPKSTLKFVRRAAQAVGHETGAADTAAIRPHGESERHGIGEHVVHHAPEVGRWVVEHGSSDGNRQSAGDPASAQGP